jgi:hypothetical protein
MAEAMTAQDGLYELIVQNPDGNEYEVISSISATHSGSDVATFVGVPPPTPRLSSSARPSPRPGICPAPSGGIDLTNAAVQADIAALKAGDGHLAVTTAPGKFVAGLLARRAADAGSITFLPVRQRPRQRPHGRGRADLAGRGRRSDAGGLDVRQRRLRHHDGRPDHAQSSPRRPGRPWPPTRASTTRPPSRPSRSPSGSSRASSPADAPPGRAPEPPSSTTSLRTNCASCGCSTARTR